MTSYEPPTEDLAIFDPSVFSINDEPLTYSQAVKKFLKYPIAQSGTETIASLNTGGVLEIRQNGTTGVKILNNQTGSAAQPPTSGRTDFFNEDTTGTEVNSLMIDYSGIHTGTLNTIDHINGTLNICPNIARAAPINIATGTNATSGCVVNIANGTGTNSSIIRMGKNNLINIDNATSAVNISGVPIKLNNTATGDIGIGFAGSGGSNIVDINNGASSTGAINIGNGSGTSAQAIRIGRNNALTVLNGSGTTQIDLIGALRFNATGATTNTITMAGQANASGSIDIANGSNGLATVSICSGSTNNGVLNLGNCGSGSTGTINIGANGGTGLIQMGSTGRAIDFRGSTISMFPTTFQVTGTLFSVGSGTGTLFNGGGVTIGNSAQASSLLTIAQNTNGLVAGNLGFTTNIGPTVFTFSTKTSSNFFQATTISAPAYQVSLISITCNFTSPESANIFRYGASLSATTASRTEVRAGFSFFEELDITPTTANTFSTVSLSGVYTNTTASAVTLYLNTALDQNWVSFAPTLTYTISITKIG